MSFKNSDTKIENPKPTGERSSFSGKIGFVLAAAGSAVGLGNIWRFPYLAAQHGGGIFLLVYILLSVTFGFTLMVAEVAIGRKTGLSPPKVKSAYVPSLLISSKATDSSSNTGVWYDDIVW